MAASHKLSATDTAIKVLETRIVEGQYRPGEKLPTESELSKDLSVGRSTVREAVRFLQAIGYVEMRAGKGTFVRTATPVSDSGIKWLMESKVQLTDFLEIRRVLEPFAAKQAAKRMTDAEILELKGTFDQLTEAFYAHDLTALTYYDEQFHLKIILGTGNALLIRLYKETTQLMREYFRHSNQQTEAYADALEPHRRIWDAIAARDSDLAEFEMLSHVMLSARHFRQAIQTECSPS